MKKLLTLVFPVFLLVFVVSNAMATKPCLESGLRNTGKIQGTITVAGQPFLGLVYIPGASFVAKTDDQGNYVLYYVPVGLRTVMLEASSGDQMIVGTCKVRDQQTCTLNISVPCILGMTKPCPLNLGVCAGKTQTCMEDGSWSACDYGEFYSQTEICADGKDNNCNGSTDEGCASCIDMDGDGFYANCNPFDCNDNDASIYPGAVEKCDGKDNNCNGITDEGCPSCIDMDGDGFYANCNPFDCNDNDANIFPGAEEVCDGKDNDCNGDIDEGCQ